MQSASHNLPELQVVTPLSCLISGIQCNVYGELFLHWLHWSGSGFALEGCRGQEMPFGAVIHPGKPLQLSWGYDQMAPWVFWRCEIPVEFLNSVNEEYGSPVIAFRHTAAREEFPLSLETSSYTSWCIVIIFNYVICSQAELFWWLSLMP